MQEVEMPLFCCGVGGCGRRRYNDTFMNWLVWSLRRRERQGKIVHVVKFIVSFHSIESTLFQQPLFPNSTSSSRKSCLVWENHLFCYYAIRTYVERSIMLLLFIIIIFVGAAFVCECMCVSMWMCKH